MIGSEPLEPELDFFGPVSTFVSGLLCLCLLGRPAPWWPWGSRWQRPDSQVSRPCSAFTHQSSFKTKNLAYTSMPIVSFVQKCSYIYIIFLTQQGVLSCRPWSRWSRRWNKPFRASRIRWERLLWCDWDAELVSWWTNGWMCSAGFWKWILQRGIWSKDEQEGSCSGSRCQVCPWDFPDQLLLVILQYNDQYTDCHSSNQLSCVQSHSQQE